MTDIFDDIDAVRWPLVLDAAGKWQETGECQEGHALAFIDPPSHGGGWRWDAWDHHGKHRITVSNATLDRYAKHRGRRSWSVP